MTALAWRLRGHPQHSSGLVEVVVKRVDWTWTRLRDTLRARLWWPGAFPSPRGLIILDLRRDGRW